MATNTAAAPAESRMTRNRWTVCALLFFATTINYIDRQVIGILKPVLETWAAKIEHIGGIGDGHRMKLLNNFVSLGYAAIYSEALALAGKVGISPQRFDAVISGGRMDCPFYQTFRRWTLEGDREAHKFTIANAFKDLKYLESMADAAGIVNPLGNAVKNSFAVAHAAGAAADYVPMLPMHIGRINGVDLSPRVKDAVDPPG